MEEVNVFIKPPPGVTAQQIQCDITTNHVTLGLRGTTDKFLNALGSNQQEATKQQMMLERFQEENPGFDFSNAEFNGAAPDPRTFMGGVKYT
ncbi:HSP20-like chaperone [Phytophthora cactorum]|nr:HSP20-like chaperone [Phytophthora cactorum]